MLLAYLEYPVADSILVSPQEELETWIRGDEGLVVEGNTISVTEEVQSLPVCALSSENLKKEGLQPCSYMLYTVLVGLGFHSLFMYSNTPVYLKWCLLDRNYRKVAHVCFNV